MTSSIVKRPAVGGHVGLHDDLQQEVAELVAEVGRVVAIEGVERLVRLLEQAAAQALRCLLAIPWAAFRSAQTANDLDQLAESAHRATVPRSVPVVKSPAAPTVPGCGSMGTPVG